VPVLSLPEPVVVSEPEPEPEPEALEPELELESEPPERIMVSDANLSHRPHEICHQEDILGHEARAILTTAAASSLGHAWAVQSRIPYW
jgi:hypothetical protein